ncbi:MAG: hypothetical protein KKA42_11450, partial [candidate division Zixibacteria bacterium]|nr:hypothetical protein [candidate division Zixibacteria bacterium]
MLPATPAVVVDDNPGGSVIAGKIHFLYTNIGRGHPFYLDGIAEALQEHGGRVGRMDHDVFTVSSGPSRWGWLLARRAYRVGSSDGTAGRLYTRLRESADYNQSGLMMRIMGHSLRKTFLSDPRPLVVAHPSLVGMLRGHPALIYQHGELVVPDEAVVLGARTVLVPTEDAARPFGAAGYRADQVMVTGLCVELSLRRQAEDAYRVRLARMKDDRPLT